METSVSFMSDGFRLAGILHTPADLAPGDKRPAVLVLHGFGTGKDGSTPEILANMFCDWGYIALRFDMRSCGDSEGEKGLLRCLDQVEDTRNAVTWIAEQDGVDPERIGAIGHSLGGHNALFVAVFDERIKVIVSSCGWTPFHDYYGGKIAGWTSDRYMPRLKGKYGLDPDRVPFDFYEVVAALAPRAFFSSSPLGDHNFDVAGVRKGILEARKVYKLFGADKSLQVRYPDCGHDFPDELREEAYKVIDSVLQPEPR